ncbi:MAG: CDP-diacylglycerol--glycerol-3-phosphate 3-phosphatidyltransferase [Pseudanabaena sp.]|jgi:CDP-diacylglycerol--glycerol-3-phosphate 3-phosphatidyltransferase|nr:CDP-diacylglycerol--glycerol-3-phosphate 3-phosphatidyltransferase [Pseudanabaena sp. M53BS1SP1A06MG]MCA6580706.1 CDP-diacylglycerol--glycerol-3-phosphate 3-phosphatidyltransferase [Pseudanabaena sp. M34BS1SP1A06MG]MCA6584962.1 CDP-diacylglycerol--glycerol-3-phosphate 3-phosphatidyltransferase [Pseudanabaena sp. M051S1SP1A06QC]MCA6590679.1 CDP-diacylglycerol--glycerol-3-phosphate 3-phosphatidyltransferase [Pseudanabaena sp. M38BS1SP1A06MG]MCA6601089.1 CDP-diacylglycerol--glycerol-3-phosphate
MTFSTITLPTWVTLSRLIAIPIIFGLFIWQDSELTRLIALCIFLIAAITDWLDGYLARKLNQITELGKFLDPLVDKVLTIALFLLFIELGEVPAWAVFMIVTRELLITAWRGAPSMGSDTDPSPIIAANFWGKAKTVMQIVAIAVLLIKIPYAIVFFWIAVALTLISGILYVVPTSKS